MAEDVIVVDIDDSKLSNVLMRLQLLGVESKRTTGSRNINKSLPRLNRELRIILGQIPGMRQLLAYYTRAERLERGIALGGVHIYLAIITTAIVLINQLQQHQRRLERQQQQYEAFIQREKGFTHDQFTEWQKQSDNFFRGTPG